MANTKRKQGSAGGPKKSGTAVGNNAWRLDEDSFSFGREWKFYPHKRGVIARRVGGSR